MIKRMAVVISVQIAFHYHLAVSVQQQLADASLQMTRCKFDQDLSQHLRVGFKHHLKICYIKELNKVHSMHLSPKISCVEFTVLSAWRNGYILNYTLWRTGEIKCKS